MKRPLILAGVVLFPLILGSTQPQVVQEVRIWSTNAISPILEYQTKAMSFIRKRVRDVIEWPSLQREKEALTKKLALMEFQINETAEIKRENERLHSLLNLKSDRGNGSLAARVIGKDPSEWVHYITIDKGSNQGVRENTVLIHAEGLAGKVVNAGMTSSRAILIVDRQSRVSAMNERSRDPGLIEGTGTALLKMTYLDREAKLRVGDKIISSGLGGIYPKGIPIGIVEMIAQEAERPGLYALVRPFVAFSKLEELLCVSPQTDN